MQMTIYNSAKCRLETVRFEIKEENTTWFDDSPEPDSIYTITDFEGGLLIKQGLYDTPIWIDGVSRDDIGNDQYQVEKLLNERVGY